MVDEIEEFSQVVVGQLKYARRAFDDGEFDEVLEVVEDIRQFVEYIKMLSERGDSL